MAINLTIFDCTSKKVDWNDTFVNIPKVGRISTIAAGAIAGIVSFIASFYVANATLYFSCVAGFAGIGAVFVTKVFLDCFLRRKEEIDEIEMTEVKKEPLKRSFCTEESYEEVSISDEEQIARRRRENIVSSDDFVPESRQTLKRSPREEKPEKNSTPKRHSPKMADPTEPC